MRKADVKRPYPPEFVSATTLAYLMDASERSIEEDVKRGFLPKPVFVGNKKRWYWPDIVKHLVKDELAGGGDEIQSEEDEYDRRLDLVDTTAPRQKAYPRVA